MVGVWVCVALLVLLGMAALVIDVGRVVIAAQRVQHLVDAAALAGAVELPDAAQAEFNLQQLVATNNETSNCQISVNPDEDITYYEPGDDIPGYGALESRANAWEVVGHVSVEYSFARLFGLHSAEVTRRAVAKAGGKRSGDAIFFAGESSAGKTGITMNGSSQYVDGTIHSNSKVTINGSQQTITGDVEYRYSYIQNGSDFTLGGRFVETGIEPYPVDYTWEQFDQGPWDQVMSSITVNGLGQTLASGRWKVNGNMTINGNGFFCQDCLFVVDGNITFNGGGTILDRVTLVATGKITFNGSTERFSCFQDNLFAFSTKSSSGTVITVNGADSDTWGIIFAPNGGVVYNGANQEMHHGAVIANLITVNGSEGTFEGMGEGGDDQPPHVELIV